MSPQLVSEFGPHLMLDCRSVNNTKTGDMALVFEFLNTLPERIGMTKITQPYVFPYSGLIPEDAGVTGTVIIAESHLSFHSFVHKDYFFFDLFSCKHFDVNRVRDIVIETFEVQDYEMHHVSRGRHFPRTLSERVPLVGTYDSAASSTSTVGDLLIEPLLADSMCAV